MRPPSSRPPPLPACSRADAGSSAARFATAAAVQRMVDSAGRAGLPLTPGAKALEGGARPLATGSRRHRALRGNSAGPRALGGEAGRRAHRGAGALRAGLPPSALRRLRSLRSGRPLVVPIAVLTDLVTECRRTRRRSPWRWRGMAVGRRVRRSPPGVQTRRRASQPGGPRPPAAQPAPIRRWSMTQGLQCRPRRRGSVLLAGGGGAGGRVARCRAGLPSRSRHPRRRRVHRADALLR
jgi:hypothetical protein